ncbi:hypothetical protein RCL1_005645 [Eukaryota sp. TZLM3-RCL]
MVPNDRLVFWLNSLSIHSCLIVDDLIDLADGVAISDLVSHFLSPLSFSDSAMKYGGTPAAAERFRASLEALYSSHYFDKLPIEFHDPDVICSLVAGDEHLISKLVSFMMSCFASKPSSSFTKSQPKTSSSPRALNRAKRLISEFQHPSLTLKKVVNESATMSLPYEDVEQVEAYEIEEEDSKIVNKGSLLVSKKAPSPRNSVQMSTFGSQSEISNQKRAPSPRNSVQMSTFGSQSEISNQKRAPSPRNSVQMSTFGSQSEISNQKRAPSPRNSREMSTIGSQSEISNQKRAPSPRNSRELSTIGSQSEISNQKRAPSPRNSREMSTIGSQSEISNQKRAPSPRNSRELSTIGSQSEISNQKRAPSPRNSRELSTIGSQSEISNQKRAPSPRNSRELSTIGSQSEISNQKRAPSPRLSSSSSSFASSLNSTTSSRPSSTSFSSSLPIDSSYFFSVPSSLTPLSDSHKVLVSWIEDVLCRKLPVISHLEELIEQFSSGILICLLAERLERSPPLSGVSKNPRSTAARLGNWDRALSLFKQNKHIDPILMYSSRFLLSNKDNLLSFLNHLKSVYSKFLTNSVVSSSRPSSVKSIRARSADSRSKSRQSPSRNQPLSHTQPLIKNNLVKNPLDNAIISAELELVNKEWIMSLSIIPNLSQTDSLLEDPFRNGLLFSKLSRIFSPVKSSPVKKPRTLMQARKLLENSLIDLIKLEIVPDSVLKDLDKILAGEYQLFWKLVDCIRKKAKTFSSFSRLPSKNSLKISSPKQNTTTDPPLSTSLRDDELATRVDTWLRDWNILTRTQSLKNVNHDDVLLALTINQTKSNVSGLIATPTNDSQKRHNRRRLFKSLLFLIKNSEFKGELLRHFMDVVEGKFVNFFDSYRRALIHEIPNQSKSSKVEPTSGRKTATPTFKRSQLSRVQSLDSARSCNSLFETVDTPRVLLNTPSEPPSTLVGPPPSVSSRASDLHSGLTSDFDSESDDFNHTDNHDNIDQSFFNQTSSPINFSRSFSNSGTYSLKAPSFSFSSAVPEVSVHTSIATSSFTPTVHVPTGNTSMSMLPPLGIKNSPKNFIPAPPSSQVGTNPTSHLAQSIFDWLSSLGLEVSEPSVFDDDPVADFSGLFLCQLLIVLERKEIDGVVKNPTNSAHNLANLRLAVKTILTLPCARSITNLDEHSLLRGDREEVVGLLKGLMNFYKFVKKNSEISTPNFNTSKLISRDDVQSEKNDGAHNTDQSIKSDASFRLRKLMSWG